MHELASYSVALRTESRLECGYALDTRIMCQNVYILNGPSKGEMQQKNSVDMTASRMKIAKRPHSNTRSLATL